MSEPPEVWMEFPTSCIPTHSTGDIPPWSHKALRRWLGGRHSSSHLLSQSCKRLLLVEMYCAPALNPASIVVGRNYIVGYCSFYRWVTSYPLARDSIILMYPAMERTPLGCGAILSSVCYAGNVREGAGVCMTSDLRVTSKGQLALAM